MAARPDVAELDAELRAVEQELARPDVIADLAKMDRVLDAAAGPAGPLGRGRRARPRGRGAQPAPRRSASRGATSALPTSELSGGQRKLVGAGGLPDPPAATCSCSTSPRPTWTPTAAAQLEELVARVRGRRGHGLARPLPARRDGLPDRRARQRGRSRCGPATTARSPWRRRSRCSASSSSTSRSRRRSRAWRTPSRRFKLWASIVVNERHIKQARNKQRQIDRMDKIDKPVFERRKIALGDAERAARRQQDRRAARRHRGVRRRPRAAGRSTHGARGASGSA